MIPVCTPTIAPKQKEYVDDCLDSNWISSNGKYISMFEDAFAKFCGTKYAVSCVNGTAALHLALLALSIGEEDEVIVPDFTMIASSNSVIYTGAKPIIVDCDKRTWNIDPKLIEKRITKNTKAIMPVHIYGHSCDMNTINDIARKNGLFVIEDAAEAHGAEYFGKKAGNLSDIAAFSFYANKIITTGEGGMVVTNDKDLADKVMSLKDHAFGVPRFFHNDIGFNYRMTNIAAAIGAAQMEIADELVNSRIRNAKYYNKRLKDIKGITLPPETEEVKNVYWMYGVLINADFGITRDEFARILKEKGVETRNFFVSMHRQPTYVEKKVKNVPDCDGEFPNSAYISERGLYLPSSSSLKIDELEYVCNIVWDIYRGGALI